MKRILGLDLGTNSIGWALLNYEFQNDKSHIIDSGSRIIPMSKKVLSDFEKGVTKSQTAERTEDKGVRRLYERSNTRRERLHRVLNVLGYLPKYYAKHIDFEHKKGQFKYQKEPLIAYKEELDENRKRIFLFIDSYLEMEKEFRQVHPNLPKLNKKGKPYRLPYDWTLYYLRKKGLTKELTNEELSWILLNFNQKRGYYQSRNEQEVNLDENKTIEYKILHVSDFVETEDKVENKTLHDIVFKDEEGNIYDDSKKRTTNPALWKNKATEFIVTTTLKKDGSLSRSYREVKEEGDWEAIKRKTEQDLGDEFVGKYIYEALLKSPSQKIKGELIRTIDRDFYFDELEVILRNQLNYRKAEWQDNALYKKAVEELYPNNIEHRENLLKQKDKFIHLFLRDILFYHRPLKSQKSLISKCTFEKRYYLDKETGKKHKVAINGIPKSHPLFQEFRIWQLVHNLKIRKRETETDGKLILNVDVTDEFLKTEEDFAAFFDFLYNRDAITQKQLVSFFIKDKKEQSNYRWNYTDDDKLKLDCNQTRPTLLSKFSKGDKSKFADALELKLWHIIYSVTNNKEYTSAIGKLVKKNHLNEETKRKLEQSPMLKKEYASYSEKAIKKLLPLMRVGKYWQEDKIDDKTRVRIDKLLTGEFDETIQNRVREKAINLSNLEDFQGLPLWLASYIVYGKHAEVDVTQWKTSKDLRDFITGFKQHSLRNPIVEQVLLESLRVTLDIWEHYAKKLVIDHETYVDERTGKEHKKYKRLFDEIHIEIGRDLKNPKKVRERISDSINKNKATNQRIRKLLYELKNFEDIKEVRPKSKTHFDKLKIYEQTVLSLFTDKELEKETLEGKLTVDKFIKKAVPTTTEILRYKLWLEQKYVSPYTQRTIPLSDLFTTKYEIEHIIPQGKFLDNSFNNKVICEATVNSLKDNRTAYAFIQEFQETEVPLGEGKSVTIPNQVSYQKFVKENYSGKKLSNLLLEEIPQKLSEREKTDMRYISKAAIKIFSNIVREDGEQESTVKNVLPVSGGVTAKLREKWGLNAVWNGLVEDRFKRLNRLICGKENEENGLFGSVKKDGGFFKPEVPLELKSDFELKRIDHRHHALDAIVIACATRAHVNYINNEHAKENTRRYDLGKTLRETKNIEKTDVLTREKTKHTVLGDYKKPWASFTADAKYSLQVIVISFKQNLRAINKATNYNWRYKNEKGEFLYNKNGKKKKQRVEQTNGKTNWAIRKPLHKDTYFGLIENGEHEGNLVKREPLNISFTEKRINDVVDPMIKAILLNHLQQEKFKNQKDENGKKLKPHEVAFSPAGIADMNQNILVLNNGIFHHPIKKVRLKFTKGKQFSIKKWIDGNDNLVRETKFVVTAQDTNLYFCIYEKQGDRKYYVPRFEEIIETQKLEQNLPLVKKKNVPENHPEFPEYQLRFYLQPNDLVYVPSHKDELINFESLSKRQLNNIYKFIDGTGTTANFAPMYVSDVIFSMKNDTERMGFLKTYSLDNGNKVKNELGIGSAINKNQNTIEGVQVKSVCWKLTTNRLGIITKVEK